MKDLTAITKRAEIGLWLNAAGLTGEGVEIGVQNGENAADILTHWRGTLHLVDPWEKQPAEQYRDGTNDIDFSAALATTLERMKPFADRFIIHRAYSDEAFERYQEDGKRFSFVYIDGNHSSPQVDRDLENWWMLLEPGALFGGHDYLNLDADCWRCDVKTAVDAFAARRGLAVHVTNDVTTEAKGGWPSWWILKPE